MNTHALIEMRERDRANGIDPTTHSVVELGPPAPPPPHISELIEPVDWERELAERQAAERAEAERARTEIVQEELERLAEHERADPAPKRRRWHV